MGGGVQEVTIISEPGVYRLVFRSRKPEAERFKRWLAREVLPQIRHTGQYTQRCAARTVRDRHPARAAFRQDGLSSHGCRLRGREAAVAMMPHIGLPDLDMIIGQVRVAPDGHKCLAHVLNWRNDRGLSVRKMLPETLNRGEAISQHLRQLGLRAVPDGEPGMAIATNPRATSLLFVPTKWDGGRHVAALRGLPGASSMRTMKFDTIASNAIFIQAHFITSSSAPPQATR